MFDRLKVSIVKRAVKRRLGKVIRPVENMSANPDLLVAYARFGQTLQKQHQLDAKLKAMARVRAAKLIECPF